MGIIQHLIYHLHGREGLSHSAFDSRHNKTRIPCLQTVHHEYRLTVHAWVIAASLDSMGAPAGFFDGIEYQKGGSVMRMLRAYLNRDRVPAAQLAYTAGGRKLLQVC